MCVLLFFSLSLSLSNTLFHMGKMSLQSSLESGSSPEPTSKDRRHDRAWRSCETCGLVCLILD